MLKGIDVSYANGTIQWNKVKNSGIDFAVIRSSFGSYSVYQIDEQFYNNADGCIKYQVPFGIYHFAYFTSKSKAVEEADFAVRMANIYKNYIRFIVLDIEDDTERYAHECGKYPDWTECTTAFLERVREAGYTPVLYANQNWLINKLDYEKVKKYKLWYAAIDVNAPKYSPSLWQYSWNGSISGINGNVDMNCCYDDSLFTGEKVSENSEQSLQTVDYSVEVRAKDGLNVRSGAGLGNKILTALSYGTIVKVIARTSADGYQWGLITYKNITGWVALDYTAKLNVSVKKGNIVRLKNGVKAYGTDRTLDSWVYNTSFEVMEVSGNRVVIGIGGNITAAVDKNFLTVTR